MRFDHRDIENYRKDVFFFCVVISRESGAYPRETYVHSTNVQSTNDSRQTCFPATTNGAGFLLACVREGAPTLYSILKKQIRDVTTWNGNCAHTRGNRKYMSFLIKEPKISPYLLSRYLLSHNRYIYTKTYTNASNYIPGTCLPCSRCPTHPTVTMRLKPS